jgi:inorganic phosphate transporter, PiT family
VGFAAIGIFTAIALASPAAFAVLISVFFWCWRLVLAFAFSNGFPDTANAMATVIYTHTLKPVPAMVPSGTLHFPGVVLGGRPLVELLPPDVLPPSNGNPAAVAMLRSLFLATLIWNVARWWLRIPSTSSHAAIGYRLGIAVMNSIAASRCLGQGVEWSQVWSVLRALFVSPLLFFLWRRADPAGAGTSEGDDGRPG